MIANKNEVRLYYETHNLKAPAVAKLFKISYRTLAYWIKTEGWERAKALKELKDSELSNPLVQSEVIDVIDVAKKRLGQQMKENLGDYTQNIDSLILANMLSQSTQDLLLQNISSSFIQKNIMLCALLAKDELLKYNELRDPTKADPVFIACAEKVAKLFSDMQSSLYGKEIPKITDASKDLSTLSTQELLEIINK